MQQLTLFALFLLLLAVLLWAGIKTLVDLLERGPHEAPLLSDDGLPWHSRNQTQPASEGRPAQSPAWSTDR